MIRLFIFSLFLHSVSFAQVQTSERPQKDFGQELNPSSSKACYCETGNWPTSQLGFFQIGCEVWLTRQHDCNLKKVIVEDTSYISLQMPQNTKMLNIGYVGHWNNSKHFVDYLDASIIPFMHSTRNSVFVDNTACDAMNDPVQVYKFLSTQTFQKDQSLVARGNQVTSIGTWDIVLPPSDNFTAEVSSQVDHVIYPDCEKYEFRACIESIQQGELGYCVDKKQSTTELVCCESADSGFEWLKAENCAPYRLQEK